VNEKGYKVLDPHIGVIYGDSITLDRAEQICRRLEAKGFASTNVVLGIGSYTYNYNTRDSLGIAVKSTYCEVVENGFVEKREIFKDPVTDDGTKKSARGLLCVKRNENGELYLKDRCTEEEERNESLLTTVFHNGNYIVDSFAAIKQRLQGA
jgi:nicotinamide phosphoribosyltransferase